MRGARPLTPSEVRWVLRHFDTPRDRALFLLMVYTGARISEAISLEVSDVIRPGQTLAIRQQIVFKRQITKGERESRSIPVHPVLSKALTDHLASDVPHRTAGPLFISRKTRDGEPSSLTRTAAWRRLNAAFRDANLGERVSPHSTRKTFAQRLHDAGNSLPVIQVLMGHADVADTIEYFRVPEEECDRAILSLPALEDHPISPGDDP